MRVREIAVASLLFLGSLGSLGSLGCKDKADLSMMDPPEASVDAAARPVAPLDPNCCKHVKVGQRYLFHMMPDMTEERRIEEITPTEIAYNAKLTSPGKAAPVVIREKKGRWNLAERSDMTRAKPGIVRKEVATETLLISGQSFECKVFEGDEGPSHFKEWRSTKFPFTIKMSVGGERSLELTAIE
jgi:hypothetical protein